MTLSAHLPCEQERPPFEKSQFNSPLFQNAFNIPTAKKLRSLFFSHGKPPSARSIHPSANIISPPGCFRGKRCPRWAYLPRKQWGMQQVLEANEDHGPPSDDTLCLRGKEGNRSVLTRTICSTVNLIKALRDVWLEAPGSCLPIPLLVVSIFSGAIPL